MKSKITIEVDFGKAIPFIQVHNEHISPDLRDKSVSAFFERLGHTSSWAKLICESSGGFIAEYGGSNYTNWSIYPITPQQLREEAQIMLAQADLLDKQPVVPSMSL